MVVPLTLPGLFPCIREAEKEKVGLHFHLGVTDLRLFLTCRAGTDLGVTMAWVAPLSWGPLSFTLCHLEQVP